MIGQTNNCHIFVFGRTRNTLSAALYIGSIFPGMGTSLGRKEEEGSGIPGIPGGEEEEDGGTRLGNEDERQCFPGKEKVRNPPNMFL